MIQYNSIWFNQTSLKQGHSTIPSGFSCNRHNNDDKPDVDVIKQNKIQSKVQRNKSILRSINVNPILLLEFFQVLFPLLRVHPTKRLMRLVVEDDEVSVTYVKTRQVLTGNLCVENIFVNYIGCAFSVWAVS